MIDEHVPIRPVRDRNNDRRHEQQDGLDTIEPLVAQLLGQSLAPPPVTGQLVDPTPVNAYIIAHVVGDHGELRKQHRILDMHQLFEHAERRRGCGISHPPADRIPSAVKE